jgi:hypothetical protein
MVAICAVQRNRPSYTRRHQPAKARPDLCSMAKNAKHTDVAAAAGVSATVLVVTGVQQKAASEVPVALVSSLKGMRTESASDDRLQPGGNAGGKC